ncbi:Arylsulfatase A [Thermomonospora echinospora]|uniref:Arylsulfatase A n=1 Tax=Thermomonospora echinospora TaxID=1992 RepID=A0A1H6D2K1_9ACTN|nr:Arylsulfatase A [Thermomonospora echinospora]
MSRPNIVVIMTDDQDAASMAVMPNVRRLLVDQGTSYTNSYASYSLCCPSRATFMTGQYAHNHKVLDNQWPDGGYRRLPKETLPLWLGRSGYATVHIGKFLNQYGHDPEEIPPGWQEWYGLVGNFAYKMWGYRINENGTVRRYGKQKRENPKLYQTDVLANKAVNYIKRRAKSDRPFFLSFAPLAPHTEPPWKGDPDGTWRGPRPAPRHRGMFAKRPLPRPPSFNETDVKDKPRHLRPDRMSAARIKQVTADYRMRLESLQAVDEAVARIVRTVAEAGELDRTLFVFTSDNGYLLGQHRWPSNKTHPYEESIRIPLVLRGPGFAKGRKVATPVVNVDLPATILSVTGARAPVPTDGRPLQELARSNRARDVLIETGPRSSGAHWYAAIRTDRYLYVEHSTGARELYDLVTDPYQLSSKHNDPRTAPLQVTLSQRLRKLRVCSGRACP